MPRDGASRRWLDASGRRDGDDGVDNDGDPMTDCADEDCYGGKLPAVLKTAKTERTTTAMGSSTALTPCVRAIVCGVAAPPCLARTW